MMLLGCTGTAFATEINVKLDGKAVGFTDAKPFVDENGRTMVPLRPVAEAMGIDVKWDRRTKTATFSETLTPGIEGFGYDIHGKQVYGRIVYMSLAFQVGEEQVKMFGKVEKDSGEETMIADQFQMDTEPVVKDGRTYAPLRYMVQSFGYDVGWDQKTKTVTVTDYRTE
jgi:hypothetical protein